jgi:hypothetical protein
MSENNFEVITWSSKTTKSFPTYDEAMTYIRENSPDSWDWWIQPIKKESND